MFDRLCALRHLNKLLNERRIVARHLRRSIEGCNCNGLGCVVFESHQKDVNTTSWFNNNIKYRNSSLPMRYKTIRCLCSPITVKLIQIAWRVLRVLDCKLAMPRFRMRIGSASVFA
jgi:hypothetical protein